MMRYDRYCIHFIHLNDQNAIVVNAGSHNNTGLHSVNHRSRMRYLIDIDVERGDDTIAAATAISTSIVERCRCRCACNATTWSCVRRVAYFQLILIPHSAASFEIIVDLCFIIFRFELGDMLRCAITIYLFGSDLCV